MTRQLRAGTLLLAAFTALSLLPGSPARAARAPSDLTASAVATHSVGLSWQPVKGAAGYRVRMSTERSMRGARTTSVAGTALAWSRLDPNPVGTGPRLAAGTTYYFQVKALRADRSSLTGYSRPIAVKTRTGSRTSELPPAFLRATPASAHALYVSWSSRGPGLRYRVRYSASPQTPLARWRYMDMDSAGGILPGLRAGTPYWIVVRVMGGRDVPLSEYSARLAVRTPERLDSPRIVLASYNVRKASGAPSWESRRDVVAAAIRAQRAHIVALQEATGIRVRVGNRKVAQHADLLARLGRRYRYVSSKPSSGTRLAYDTGRFTLTRAEVVRLSASRGSPRYVVWAILKDRVGGRSVMVVNVHLQPSFGLLVEDNEVRIQQAREVLRLIKSNNPRALPVVLAGDLNSSRATRPNNGGYRVLLEGGLVDPLGDADTTWRPAALRSEHALDREYNTYNHLEPAARRTIWPVGTRVDYLMFSPRVRVAMTRTVVAVDTNRRFTGRLGSDHNMITAAIHLP